MEYEEFLAVFRKEFEERLGGDVRTELVKVRKNNVGKKEGLAVIGGDTPIVPVIYPAEIYQGCREKGADAAEAARAAADRYMAKKHSMEPIEGIRRSLFRWEAAKGSLMPTLVNQEWNREALEEAANVPFLDLAVCFQLQAARPEGGIYSCRISKKLLSSWGLSEGELMEQALKNLERKEYVVRNIGEVLAELSGMEYLGNGEKGLSGEKSFSVLTTPEQIYGAAGILKKGLLSGYADKAGRNLYLIPSSIHEIIVIADDGNVDTECLEAMIKEVNSKHVPREEQLSDHAYYYDREKDEVRIPT